MSRRAEKFKLKHDNGGDEEDAPKTWRKPKPKTAVGEDGFLSLIPPATEYSMLSTDLLNLFRTTFRYLFESEQLEAYIQIVKGDLYNRDYLKAFSDDDRRMAYCCRWTPSRALAYSSLFSSLEEIRELIRESDSHVLSIGGGAGGELIALASLFASSKDFLNKDQEEFNMEVDLFDIADWSRIVKKLSEEVSSKWLYNAPDSLKVNFKYGDILSMDDEYKSKIPQLDLITLLFTTNELFASDKAKSIRFFQLLSNCKKNAYLLITESAGSFSHITVGTKKFPIQFLIDTILLGKDGQSGNWELINQSDSCWYRCEPKLEYPLKLENMRFFFRLYRKK